MAQVAAPGEGIPYLRAVTRSTVEAVPDGSGPVALLVGPTVHGSSIKDPLIDRA